MVSIIRQVNHLTIKNFTNLNSHSGLHKCPESIDDGELGKLVRQNTDFPDAPRDAS